MKEMVRGIFVLAVCVLLIRGINVEGDEGKKDVIIYEIPAAENISANRNVGISAGIDAANDICYISYHVEIRRDRRKENGGREVRMIRIVGK